MGAALPAEPGARGHARSGARPRAPHDCRGHAGRRRASSSSAASQPPLRRRRRHRPGRRRRRRHARARCSASRRGVKMRSARVRARRPRRPARRPARYLASPDALPLVEAEVLDAADGGSRAVLFAHRARPARGRAAPARARRRRVARRRGRADCPLRAHRREMSRGACTSSGRGRRPAGSCGALGLDGDAARRRRRLRRRARRRRPRRGTASSAAGRRRRGDAHPRRDRRPGLPARARQPADLAARPAPHRDRRISSIVAGADKVAALDPPVLHVDLGDGRAGASARRLPARARRRPIGRWCCGSRADDARSSEGGTRWRRSDLGRRPSRTWRSRRRASSTSDARASSASTTSTSCSSRSPPSHRLSRPLELPPRCARRRSCSRHLTELLSPQRRRARRHLSFLGAGCWQHYVPGGLRRDRLAQRVPHAGLGHAARPTTAGTRRGSSTRASSASSSTWTSSGLPVYSWGCAAGQRRADGRAAHRPRPAARPARARPRAPRGDPQLLRAAGGARPHRRRRWSTYDPATGRLDLDDLARSSPTAPPPSTSRRPSFLGVIEADAARDRRARPRRRRRDDRRRRPDQPRRARRRRAPGARTSSSARPSRSACT